MCLCTYTDSDYTFPDMYFNWNSLTLQTTLAENVFIPSVGLFFYYFWSGRVGIGDLFML